MSDLLKKMICLVGIEYLSDEITEAYMQEDSSLNIIEKRIFPDFDHITVI